MLVDYLNVSIHGYACELFVNDAPILRTPVDAPYTATPTVSEWLVGGDNEITVRVDAIAPPSVTADPLSPRRLIVQRCEGPLGEVVPQGQEVMRGELSFVPRADAPPALPLRLVHRFRLPPGPTWAWESAPVLTLDAATSHELRMFLAGIHADLVEGDIAGLLGRQRIKIAELAPLYGGDPAQVRGDLEQQFAALSDGGAWTVAPLHDEDLELRPCCRGRVIEPRTRDGRPVFRGRAAEATEWSLPVFIARIDGLLEIVR